VRERTRLQGEEPESSACDLGLAASARCSRNEDRTQTFKRRMIERLRDTRNLRGRLMDFPAGLARLHYRRGEGTPRGQPGAASRPPNDDLLTWCLVGPANLRRVLPNALDFIHREETLHLDVLNRTG
jgi:hypothetical protein